MYRFRLVVFLLLVIDLGGATTTFVGQQAGRWYPADPQELRKQIQDLLAAVPHEHALPGNPADIMAIVVPHAGYQYSGAIAAHGYRMVADKKVDRVIILGPAHHGAPTAVTFPAARTYTIPTGTLSIDRKAIDRVYKDARDSFGLCTISDVPFASEHSIEIQLPWVYQLYGAGVKIVPMLLGPLQPHDAVRIAQMVRTMMTDRTLVIISSDFTHYGQQYGYTPVTRGYREWVRALDNTILQALQEKSSTQFHDIMVRQRATVCGQGPLEVLLQLVHQAPYAQSVVRLVAYGDSSTLRQAQDERVTDKPVECMSGDVACSANSSILPRLGLGAHPEPVEGSERNTLVTYAALAVTKKPTTRVDTLSWYDTNTLLRIARSALERHFDPQRTPYVPVLSTQLAVPKGCFVTLYTRLPNGVKQLRGCIGRTIPNLPLYQLVEQITLESALRDTRFRPVTASELQTITIEISVLELPHEITSYRDIVLGKDGIILSAPGASALFLPKVAREFGWTLEQTLTELSQKAGLQPFAWKDPLVHFAVFRAVEFGEQESTDRS